MTPLTAEQREAIVFPEGSASAMVQDAMVFLRSYVSGSQTLRLQHRRRLTHRHPCLPRALAVSTGLENKVARGHRSAYCPGTT